MMCDVMVVVVCCVAVSGWDEEKYDALLNLASIAETTSQPMHTVVSLYLNGTKHSLTHSLHSLALTHTHSSAL